MNFDKLGIESFLQHEELERPLDEIEEQIKNKTRGERAVFENRLYECDLILAEVADGKNFLRERCKFDSDDLEGSIATLERVFIDKLIAGCDEELNELEEDFCFLVRKGERDSIAILENISNLKMEIRQIKEQLPSIINCPEELEEAIKSRNLNRKRKKINCPKKFLLTRKKKKFSTS